MFLIRLSIFDNFSGVAVLAAITAKLRIEALSFPMEADSIWGQHVLQNHLIPFLSFLSRKVTLHQHSEDLDTFHGTIHDRGHSLPI